MRETPSAIGTARFRAAWVLAGSIIALAGASPAAAAPVYAYQQTLQIPGTTAANLFTGYDLAAIDPATRLYYLTDRSNNGIDVYSTLSNTFVGRIGAGLFTGTAGGNNDIAGPNGISISNTAVGKLLVTGDGASNVVSFNLDSAGLNVLGAPRSVSTAVAGTPAPPNRVDGVAYAPTANTILAANNASDPGFVTLIDNATGAVIRSIPLDGTGGYPDAAGNGVEATIFNTARGTFFVAVPTLDTAGTGPGGVIELDPADGRLLNTFDFAALGVPGACSPTGVSQGAGAAVFVACSDPDATGSLVLDPAGSGSVRAVPGIRGGDQTYYDPVTNTFFQAARAQPGGPVLGVVDADTLALQVLPIGVNDHSVAAYGGLAYVASGPTAAIPGCTFGCIGVFAAATPVPEPGTLPLLASAVVIAGLAITRRKGHA